MLIAASTVTLAACGAGDTATTTAGDSSTVSGADPVLPLGFERGLARVTKSDGTTCEICVWRAVSGDQRSTGLMGVTDLGPAVGMTFEYGALRDGWFWMKNTVLPLSIAFFDGDGVLVDAFDMEPCTGDPCEQYHPAASYRLAIEMPQGELATHGITDGSRLDLLDLPCDE